MEAQRWQRVKTLVATALELPRAERAAFLERECGGDAVLLEEVVSLVTASDEAESFLEQPATEMADALREPASISWIGRRVGSYRIVGEMGHGGMGEVYRAVRADDQFDKEVAIKLVRRGYDTDYFVGRFKAERQILATLDHSNIARLLDGGVTDEGLPYFVMELIEGRPIDEYCTERALPVRARLELFLMVCAAVHFAHQRLVIHGDIKPGNILVTGDGEAKLLDFGIAKLMDQDAAPASALTVTRFHALTPAYASPEQLRHEPVTTASDVYSLGVLLFELLTGSSPYRTSGVPAADIERAVLETDAERPSTVVRRAAMVGDQAPTRPGPDARRLRRQLRGDLDNIVLMALRKQPQRRYRSVEQFAEDIRRHLVGLPVVARPDTWAYRSGKFLRRHAIGMTAASAVVVALVAGILMARHEASIANAERERAERHFQEVRKLANAFLFEVHDAIQNLPGSTEARRLLVKNALEYLNALAAESSGDVSLQRELATAYEKVGDVQGGFRAGSLGDTAGALDSFARALAIRTALLSTLANDPDLLRETARNHSKMGDVLTRFGKASEAVEHSRTALGLLEKLVVLRPDDPKTRFLDTVGQMDLGSNLAEAGDWNAGLEHCRRGLALAEVTARAHPEDPRSARSLALSYRRVAWILAEGFGQYPEAISLQEKSLAAIADRLAADPGNTDLRNIAATAHIGIGRALARQGERRRSMHEFALGLEHLEALAAADPRNAVFRFNVADALGRIGGQLVDWGDTRAAIGYLHRASAHLDKLPSFSRGDARIRVTAALTGAYLGEAQLHLATRSPTRPGLRAGACAAFREGLATLSDPELRPLLTPVDLQSAQAMESEAARLCTDGIGNQSPDRRSLRAEKGG